MTTALYDAPGPRTRRRILIGSLIGGALIVAGLAWILLTFARQGLFDADRWDIFSDTVVWEFLGQGLLNTLRAAAVAAVIACLVAAVVAALRLSSSRILRAVGRVYVEIFRGLPVLLLIFFPTVLWTSVTPFMAAVIGLAVYNSAIIAEILRSGVNTLPRGQREAGLAIGMTPLSTLRLIELPQAVRIMMPSLVSQIVVLLKDTSLAFIVTYPELLRTMNNLRDYYGSRYIFSVFFVGAAMYITVNAILSITANRLAKRDNTKTAGRVASAGTADN